MSLCVGCLQSCVLVNGESRLWRSFYARVLTGREPGRSPSECLLLTVVEYDQERFPRPRFARWRSESFLPLNDGLDL